MAEFLQNDTEFFLKQDLVYSHQATVEMLLFFSFFSEQIHFSWRKTGLHKRELLKYHDSFPILVFEVNLSLEIAL